MIVKLWKKEGKLVKMMYEMSLCGLMKGLSVGLAP